MVSVIIPTYNRAMLLGNAIESVIAQELPDWELIIVDDGSDDETEAVVKGYQDGRFRYIYQENQGTSAARNTGIRASKGEYVAFLDSDDRYLPNMLQLLAPVLENTPELCLVASGWEERDAQNRSIRTVQPWHIDAGLGLIDWLYGRTLINGAFLIRKSILLETALFDEELRYVEDWDLWLRLAYAGCRMAWVPGIVCQRTVHQESKIRDVEAMCDGAAAVLDKFFGQRGLSEEILEQKERVYARVYVAGMVRAFGAGERELGEGLLRKAIGADARLLEGQPPAVIQSVASAALTNQAPDRAAYVRDASDVLTKVSPRLALSPRQLRAAIRATAAFDARAKGQCKKARLHAAQALVKDPTWLRNHGLLKIMLKP